MSPLGVLLFVLLSTVAAGGVAFALLQPKLAASKKVAARKTALARDEKAKANVAAARSRVQEQSKRRKNLENSLREMETRAKAHDRNRTKPSLSQTLAQSGLTISARMFVLLSVGIGLFAAIMALGLGQGPIVALLLGIVCGAGLPRFALARMRKKRLERFIEHFPNAIDLIVRGIKAGLPLGDTLRTVAAEVPEPVASEFRHVVEAQQMGVGLGEACERLYRSVPLPETNFFAIVIAIQAQAGGNLSEALGNLSRVLRERKKMRQKVQAVSSEAKASGTIIGALPIAVASLVYMTAPDYIGILFQTTVGNFILIGCAVWMSIGIFVMKNMIQFEI
ncbi:MAG: type II secretion system F family protein [Fulvimarina manganoxydans]|uniref:type II secretion system F family protein n=1 Tax=Fulvimarina manganoxydans TaxID=937218 RepID=UPI00235249FC|nr:type II secretion system F family protein [Fulvimarina manganoxydans]MCK5931399.1 type II secretion system F family protein [Fulvimarina manganoxydans]